MRCILILFLALAVENAPAADLAVSSDLLAEIRDLRHDLWNTAATIQRVQIAMYRLQFQTALVDKVAGRLEQARSECKQAQSQQKLTATEIEQAEAQKRNPENGNDRAAVEQMISQLHASLETLTGEIQECQVEQTAGEAQFRAEQAKLEELQNHLDSLDQVLAAGK
jgi:chromosome segregation ATPase